MKALVLILGMIVPSLGIAETYLTLGFTDHAKNKRYCEVHPGVFNEWRYTDTRMFVGVHQNSHCEASVVGGLAYQPLTYQRYSAGVMVMGLTGYEKDLMVVPAPALSFDGKTYGVDVTGWPGILWHVRWRFSF